MQMCRSIFAKYRYLGRQMSLVISGVIRQKFIKFLHDVATASLLLMPHGIPEWFICIAAAAFARPVTHLLISPSTLPLFPPSEKPVELLLYRKLHYHQVKIIDLSLLLPYCPDLWRKN